MRLTTHGARTHGALITYVAPRLAKDAKLPDLAGILAGAPTANRISQRAGIATAIRATSRLAHDADLSDIAELLEAMERVSGEEDGEAGDPGDAVAMVDEDDEDSLIDKIRDFCSDRMSPEDYAKLEEMLGGGDRRRAKDSYLPADLPRGTAPTPGGTPESRRRAMEALQNHEVDTGGSVARDRGMRGARPMRPAAHDSMPFGVKPAEERFSFGRVRPAAGAWLDDVTRRRQRAGMAYDAPSPSLGVKSGAERFPGIASRHKGAGVV